MPSLYCLLCLTSHPIECCQKSRFQEENSISTAWQRIYRCSSVKSFFRTIVCVNRFEKLFIRLWSRSYLGKVEHQNWNKSFLTMSENLATRRHLIRFVEKREFLGGLKNVKEELPVRNI